MILNDVVKLKVTSLYNSTIECLNVFYYKLTSVGTGSLPIFTVVSEFEDFLFITNALQAPSTSILRYTSIYGENVVDPTDEIATIPVSYAGSGSGDSMPPFCAYSFRFYPALLGRRSGHKRLGGVSEAAQSGGTITDGATLVALEEIAGFLQGKWQITYGAELWELYPVIASFTLNGEPRATPLFTSVASVQASHRVGTQNTRKK